MLSKKALIEQVWITTMALFTWLVVVNGSKIVVDFFPIKNQLILGGIGIIFLLFIKPR